MRYLIFIILFGFLFACNNNTQYKQAEYHYPICKIKKIAEFDKPIGDMGVYETEIDGQIYLVTGSSHGFFNLCPKVTNQTTEKAKNDVLPEQE